MFQKSIVLYTTLPNVGGNSTITLSLAELFLEEGYGVIVIVRDQTGFETSKSVLAKLNLLGAKILVLAESLIKAASTLVLSLLFEKLFRGSHFISVGQGAIPILLNRVCLFKRSSVYYINHSPELDALRSVGRGLQSFDDLIVISPASLMAKSKLSFCPNNVVWLPQFSGFDSMNFLRMSNPGGDIRYGYLGTLSEEKGVLKIIDYWTKKTCSQSLLMMGDGPMRSEIEKIAAVTPSIDYAGSFAADKRNQMLNDFFSKIDCLLVPSLTHGEGIPTVLLEALSVGVPVIATKLGGVVSFGEEPLRSSFSPFVKLINLDHFDEQFSTLISDPRSIRINRDLCIATYEKWFGNAEIKRKWLSFVGGV